MKKTKNLLGEKSGVSQGKKIFSDLSGWSERRLTIREVNLTEFLTTENFSFLHLLYITSEENEKFIGRKIKRVTE